MRVGGDVKCRKLKGQVMVIPWRSSGWDSAFIAKSVGLIPG